MCGLWRSLFGFVFYLVDKLFAGFEGWDIVSRNVDGGAFANVAADFGGAVLDDEASEATEVNLFVGGYRAFDGGHQFFNDSEYGYFFDAGFVADCCYNFCFSHN